MQNVNLETVRKIWESTELWILLTHPRMIQSLPPAEESQSSQFWSDVALGFGDLKPN